MKTRLKKKQKKAVMNVIRDLNKQKDAEGIFHMVLSGELGIKIPVTRRRHKLYHWDAWASQKVFRFVGFIRTSTHWYIDAPSFFLSDVIYSNKKTVTFHVDQLSQFRIKYTKKIPDLELDVRRFVKDPVYTMEVMGSPSADIAFDVLREICKAAKLEMMV